MRFSEPNNLYYLIIIPIIYIIFLVAHRKRVKDMLKLGIIGTLNKFSSRDLAGNFRRQGIFASSALFFFILALARPQAGTRLETVKITGSDIYIAIDLSKSMGAEDVKPTRIERAKVDALELINFLQGDRVGLILFAGDAFVQCPLTTDYDAVTTFIKSIDFETAVASGTSLRAPLEVALDSLKKEEDKYALLLLMTDGESTLNDHERAVKEARKRGIRIFSIGIGTSKGAPIPIYDETGKRVGYKKDSTGKVVISKLRDDLLKTISQETNGYYFETGKTSNEIKRFLSTLESMKKRELETKRYTVYEERFQIPLAVGILLIFLYILTTVRMRGYEL